MHQHAYHDPSPPRDFLHLSYEPLSDGEHFPARRTRRGCSAFLGLPFTLYCRAVSRYGRRKGATVFALASFALLLFLYTVSSRLLGRWSAKPKLERAPLSEVRRVWEEDIRAGYYPSRRVIPPQVGLTHVPSNPARPPDENRSPSLEVGTHTHGTGPARIYPKIAAPPSNATQRMAYPPRPIPGSAADLDLIDETCGFPKNIRDCHEMLRLGAGLDTAGHLRREGVDRLRYVFTEDGAPTHRVAAKAVDENAMKRADRGPCHEDDPRIFHMFWSGPFTDKPYMAMLAFLYTQNLGLHLEDNSTSDACRPQLWLWIGPNKQGEAHADASAYNQTINELSKNPWAAPFMHERFKDVIMFRVWNTTEQLDATPELRNEWRGLGDKLLTSLGSSVRRVTGDSQGVDLKGKSKTTHSSYSKVPVVLSDLVRFVLCHRYGGIYLDIDMLFLRDWEELWGWQGHFAYRWSFHERYNTAVLRLRKGSALGSFILKTALKNQLDVHPITVTDYLRDNSLDRLLYRLPDALFDPNWLASDKKKFLWMKTTFQRDRPPYPFFEDFDYFFNTPPKMSGQPSMVGFDGFYRGAFLYHYHNEWWKPFDRARFWPDLGERFAESEEKARAAALQQSEGWSTGLFEHDKQDLDWSTVLKRTFEAFVRGERPNMYGEWMRW